MAKTLTIDASALANINSTTYFADFFSDFTTGVAKGSMSFWGGEPDSAFGGTYYMNGSQVLGRYTLVGDDTTTAEDETVVSDSVVVLDGADLAYDMIHYGSSFGHGISGQVDSLTFGAWGATATGEQGIGAEGRIAGLDTGLVIDGLDLHSEPGDGNNLDTNAVYAIYKALQTFDATALTGIISQYAVEITGTSGNDTLGGFAHDDVLIGGAGNDRLLRSAGADLMIGGRGDDTITGGKGSDVLQGGAGDDVLDGGFHSDRLFGGSGDDVLTGGRGADRLTGGAGADTFVIQTTSALDVITDFDAAEDMLDVTALGLSSFEDFTITETARGVDLVDGAVTIRLLGLSAADLSNDFFSF